MVGAIDAIVAPRAKSDSISIRSGWVQTRHFEPFPESANCIIRIIRTHRVNRYVLPDSGYKLESSGILTYVAISKHLSTWRGG